MSDNRPRLFIVGADDFAAEIYSWMELDFEDSKYHFGGFLSDGEQREKAEIPDPDRLVAGTVQSFYPAPDDCLVMACSDPSTKLRLGYLLETRNGKFITFVHPTALVVTWLKPNGGIVIGPNAVVCYESSPEGFVHIGPGCYVGAGVMINRVSLCTRTWL